MTDELQSFVIRHVSRGFVEQFDNPLHVRMSVEEALSYWLSWRCILPVHHEGYYASTVAKMNGRAPSLWTK